ncbi:hypothetical protein INT45_006728, partial [Circinella minor]
MYAQSGVNRYSTARQNENNNRKSTATTRIRNPIAAENKLGDLQVAIPDDLRRPLSQERQPLKANRQLTAPTNPFKQTNGPQGLKRTYNRGMHALGSGVPGIMKDKNNTQSYTKQRFLGEGGFARCYKVICPNGRFYAAKVISKSTILDEKNRTKLFAEISIHRSMNHRSIVRFINCFEDPRNVYLILELCENGTLVEMLRNRSKLTEPEVRFYLIQVLDACRYMHDNRVIHRDIKLSNTFLDKNMNVKMGDFGLAALLVDRNDRKKTICGTPNYIAPEILFEKTGHDYKVDMWSIGVLMYTLLVGKHPFQQSEVKYIYKRIRANEEKPSYKLPAHLGDNAKDLITKLLVNEPSQRLSVPEVLSHDFFQKGFLPSKIPVTALHRIPSDEELYTTSPPTNIMRSPGRAGEALRDAIDANRSYVDRRPLGELKIMEGMYNNSNEYEVIPDSRVLFPGRPVYKDKNAYDSSKKRSVAVENEPRKRRDIENIEPIIKNDTRVATPPPSPLKTREKSKVSILETMVRVLTESLEEAKAKEISNITGQPIQDMDWTPSDIFMDKWVNFTAKYGLFYSLTDNTRGVFFTDATTLLTKDNEIYYYIDHEKTPMVKQEYDKSELTEGHRKKLCLLLKFKEHMDTKLAPPAENMPASINITDRWIYLSRYIITSRAAIFRFTNGVVQ